MRSFLAPSGLTFGPLGLALAAAAVSTLLPARADAHFILDEAPDGGNLQGEPACFSEQAYDGTPEKSAPCGQDDTGIPVVPTNIVTSFTPGADGTTTITITTNEVVFHPGHYRISIASDMTSLPADPAVTVGATPCGSAAIETIDAGTISADGVIADDVLDHTAAFTSPQSYTFKVPASVHCSPQCVLQVVEFMSDHDLNPQGGCFYHHCANISIGSSGSSQGDGGAEESDAGKGTSGSSGGTGATGSSAGSASGTTGSGSGASGTTGSSGNAAGSTGSATGGSAGAGSSGSGGSSGAGSSGMATSGATGSGQSGSASAPDASTHEAGGGSTSSGGCTVATGMEEGAAPGLRFGVFALAALGLLRRRPTLRRARR